MQPNQNVVLVSETHVRLIEFAFPIVLITREGFTKKIAVLLDFVQRRGGQGGGHSGPILAFRLSNRTGGADLTQWEYISPIS